MSFQTGHLDEFVSNEQNRFSAPAGWFMLIDLRRGEKPNKINM